MCDKQGQGHLGVGKPSVADEKGGTSGGGVSGDDGDARASRDREDGRPACLPLPSPPRLPSKRTLTDRCTAAEAASKQASVGTLQWENQDAQIRVISRQSPSDPTGQASEN
ncbi:unnamed protein product [Ectocarpus sp. 12 AP-2014]